MLLNDQSQLFELPEGVETRWASHENPTGARGAGGKVRNGRKGAAWFRLPAGEEAVLASVDHGAGIVRRMWSTTDPLNDPDVLRGLILKMYWDNSAEPAVVVPMGDFFCHGPKQMATFDNALFSSPEGRSFVCMIPMPFRDGMKITVENRSGKDVKHFYYDVNYTLGDKLGDDVGYFHAYFNRQNPTVATVDHEIIPAIKGAGRFLGVNLGIVCNKEHYFSAWWGEGEVKVYLDGDTDYPTLCGTGVEDYVATAWGQDYYYSQYHGSQVYDTEEMIIGCYRLHIPDPIYFHEDIRVTVQQIGGFDTDDELNKARYYHHTQDTGHQYQSVDGGDIDVLTIDRSVHLPVLFEREEDWSSCAYFYLNSPVNSLRVQQVEQWLA